MVATSRIHNKRPKPPPVARLLETRIEQLPAEKQLLKFIGEQRRGRPLDNGDDRSAIRRRSEQAMHSSTGPYQHRAVFPPAAPAADGTSCGDSWRQQLAAEALLGMAGGTGAGRERPVQLQQSVRMAAQQRSTVDNQVAPNQPGVPMPLPHAMPMAKHFVPAQPLLQPLGPAVPVALQRYAPSLPIFLSIPTPPLHPYGGSYYLQPAAPPCWSIAPQPPQRRVYPYSIQQHHRPTASRFGKALLPSAPPPYSIAPQPNPPAPPYSIAPQPPPPAYCGTTSLWNAPPGALQKTFETLVMCAFTPRRPSELKVSRWVSINVLFRLFQPLAPGEVWLMGPGNLKQLITKWYNDHPAFKGLTVNEWCKRLTSDKRDGPGQGSYTLKFCFERTHKVAAAI
jgi:hypothetical protein